MHCLTQSVRWDIWSRADRKPYRRMAFGHRHNGIPHGRAAIEYSVLIVALQQSCQWRMLPFRFSVQ